jgi:hypothetical protein
MHRFAVQLPFTGCRAGGERAFGAVGLALAAHVVVVVDGAANACKAAGLAHGRRGADHGGRLDGPPGMQAAGANLEPGEAILAERGWLRPGRFGRDGDGGCPLEGSMLRHGEICMYYVWTVPVLLYLARAIRSAGAKREEPGRPGEGFGGVESRTDDEDRPHAYKSE